MKRIRVLEYDCQVTVTAAVICSNPQTIHEEPSDSRPNLSAVSVSKRTLSKEDLVHDDDVPVGRILTRRHALSVLGSVGAALVVGSGKAAAATTVDCVATPQ